MPRRTDIQSVRAETPSSGAPPSNEGGAAGNLADESWTVLDEAITDAEHFSAQKESTPPADAIRRLNSHLKWFRRHGWKGHRDNELYFWAVAAFSANLLNFEYRSMQRDPSKPHPWGSIEALGQKLLGSSLVDVPGQQYWTAIDRTLALTRAYEEGWRPASEDVFGPKDSRMTLAMMAVAERLGVKVTGESGGVKTIEKARRIARKHLAKNPVIYIAASDAFSLNPAFVFLLRLPRSKGRPPNPK